VNALFIPMPVLHQNLVRDASQKQHLKELNPQGKRP